MGIGINKPTSRLHVVGNSLFDGNLKINNGGRISVLGSSDGASSLVFSGQDANGTFTPNEDFQLANSVTIKGGDATGVNGVSGYGGDLFLYGGKSNASAEGSDLHLESGQGSTTGNIFMQAYQGRGGSVLLGLQKPITNTKFAVSGNSFFEGNI